MKGYYAIEYKSMAYPYQYEYYRSSNGDFRTFKSIVEARKACVSLINSRKAVLAVVRGINKGHIVYATVRGGYVLEDRQTSRNYWYRLNKNGTVGTFIPHGDGKMIAKTKQTYDVQSMSGYSYGRFTSLTEARKKACKLAYNYVGERGDIKIIKNPAILPNGYFRPATIFIIVTSVMFIRPKYDYKCFGKELVIENGKITGQYKYYLIDSRTGNISMSDPSFKRYFDGSMRSGVWNRPRK